ncbi:hypothetical protein QYE76_018184 [Lolium multiflorum]|uniref:CCHC-type domain-containing protein n=1 Tax=Lolium multiflorum TaxID=4521 RepID=A0AAD8QH41_LOLMU|nr:hypothetical protein QYE76_018184 [Lolium multiflorum]
MTLQRFLNGLRFNIKGIVRHHKYATMNELLHHAREAESQLAEEAQQRGRATGAGRYTPRPPPSTAPSTRPTDVPSSSSKPVSNVSHTKKPVPAASGTGSSMSTARNRDMLCHTCGGKGHFKKDCPNRKVMIINEDNEYETGDDADPDAPEDDDYDSDSFDAYPSEAQTIVVSQRVLNVQPSASTQRCNLFQTKALVGPDKACKVIIDGGSCRNLASKELCAKLKLKYLPHPHPYYIQWLSNNGEMKVSHMVRVDFEIGPYKDSIDFDVVPMTVCHLLLGRPWLYDRSVQHNGRANTYHLEFKGKKINLQPMSPQQIVNESRQKIEVNLEDASIAYRRRYTMAKESPKWTNNTKPRHIRQGANVDKDQERRNPHGAWKKEEEGGRKKKGRGRRGGRRKTSRSQARSTGLLTARSQARSTGLLTSRPVFDRNVDRCHPEAIPGLPKPRPVTSGPESGLEPDGPVPDPVQPAL